MKNSLLPFDPPTRTVLSDLPIREEALPLDDRTRHRMDAAIHAVHRARAILAAKTAQLERLIAEVRGDGTI